MSVTLFLLLFTLIIALYLHLTKLQKKASRFNAIFQKSPHAIVLVDNSDHIKELNPSAKDLLDEGLVLENSYHAITLPYTLERLDQTARALYITPEVTQKNSI